MASEFLVGSYKYDNHLNHFLRMLDGYSPLHPAPNHISLLEAPIILADID